MNKHSSICSQITLTLKDRTREPMTNAQQKMSICMEREFCSYLYKPNNASTSTRILSLSKSFHDLREGFPFFLLFFLFISLVLLPSQLQIVNKTAWRTPTMMSHWSEKAMISQMQKPYKQARNWGSDGHAKIFEVL